MLCVTREIEDCLKFRQEQNSLAIRTSNHKMQMHRFGNDGEKIPSKGKKPAKP